MLFLMQTLHKLSNMSPELLEKMNLSYDKLSSINPRLIYATNTGYGRFGDVSKPSFDMTVQALTGAMSRLGEPGEPPIYMGMGWKFNLWGLGYILMYFGWFGTVWDRFGIDLGPYRTVWIL